MTRSAYSSPATPTPMRRFTRFGSPRRLFRGRAPFVALVALVPLLVLLVLTSCGDSGLERDENGTIIRGGTEDVFSLEVGDCFVAPEGSDGNRMLIDSVDALPCDQPHSFEVFARETAVGANTFDADGLALFVGSSCFGENFTAYVGTPVEFTSLKVRTIEPTRQSWEQLDDRDVVCLVQSEDRSSSVRGTGV